MSDAFWPGYVARQNLNEFARSLQRQNEAAAQELMDLLDHAEAAKSTAVVHSLNESLMENFGYQKALRDTTEWATYLQPRKKELGDNEIEYGDGREVSELNGTVSELESEDNSSGMVAAVDQRIDVAGLKERFNG